MEKKFFDTKSFFEGMNFNSSILCNIGKELVKIYKDEKKGLAFWVKERRIKDGIYCWYAENFYKEMNDKDSKVNQLFEENYQKIQQKNHTNGPTCDQTLSSQNSQEQMIAKKSISK